MAHRAFTMSIELYRSIYKPIIKIERDMVLYDCHTAIYPKAQLLMCSSLLEEGSKALELFVGS